MPRVYPSISSTVQLPDKLRALRAAQPAGVVSGMGVSEGASGLKLTLNGGVWCVGGAIVVEDRVNTSFDLAHAGDASGGKQSILYGYIFADDTGDDPLYDYMIANSIDPDSVGYVSGQPYYALLGGTFSVPPKLSNLYLLDTRILDYVVELACITVPNGATAWSDAGVRVVVPDLLLSPHRAQHVAASRHMLHVEAIGLDVDGTDVMVRWRNMHLVTFASSPRQRERTRGNILTPKIRGQALGVGEDAPNDYEYKAEISNFTGDALLYVRTLTERPKDPASSVGSNPLEIDNLSGLSLPDASVRNELLIYPLETDLFDSLATDAQFELLHGTPLASEGEDEWNERPVAHSVFPIGVISTYDGATTLMLSSGIAIPDGDAYVDGIVPGGLTEVVSTILGTTATPSSGSVDIDDAIPNVGYLAGGSLGLDEAYDGTGGAAASGRDISVDNLPILINHTPWDEATPLEPFPAAQRIKLDATGTGRWEMFAAALDVVDENLLADPDETPDGKLYPARRALVSRRIFRGKSTATKYISAAGVSVTYTESGGTVTVDLASVFAEIKDQWTEDFLFSRLYIVQDVPGQRAASVAYIVSYNSSTEVFKIVDPRDSSDPFADFGWTSGSGSSASYTASLYVIDAYIGRSTLISQLNVTSEAYLLGPTVIYDPYLGIGVSGTLLDLSAQSVAELDGALSLSSSSYILFDVGASLIEGDLYASDEPTWEMVSLVPSDAAGGARTVFFADHVLAQDILLRDEDSPRTNLHDAKIVIESSTKDMLRIGIENTLGSGLHNDALSAQSFYLKAGMASPLALGSDGRDAAPADRSLYRDNLAKALFKATLTDDGGTTLITIDEDACYNVDLANNLMEINTADGRQTLMIGLEEFSSIIGTSFQSWAWVGGSADANMYAISVEYVPNYLWSSISEIRGSLRIRLHAFDAGTPGWDSAIVTATPDMAVNICAGVF